MPRNTRRATLPALALLCLATGLAQAQDPAQEQAIIVLDASGSMWGQIDGKPKLQIARGAALWASATFFLLGLSILLTFKAEPLMLINGKEKLTLRVAATILERLPNGVLRIQGSQEVRVNFEVRELIVTGFVRPEDISRQNEITYDKIAGARISYGGRGQITDVQQPRLGQQVADIILPF